VADLFFNSLSDGLPRGQFDVEARLMQLCGLPSPSAG
jgi:hypothetical protein